MNKIILAFIIFSVFISSGFITKFGETNLEPTSFLSFNGKDVENIDFEDYDFNTSFHVLDAVNSNNCERIDSIASHYVEDQKLYDWIKFQSEICFHQRANDPNFKEKRVLNISNGLFMPEKFYKDMFKFYPEDTVFVAPMENA